LQSLGLSHHRDVRGKLPFVPASNPHYRINRVIGNGRYAVVVAARSDVAGREVALKIVSRDVLRDEMTLEAFEQECRVHESLCDDAIVPVNEVVSCPEPGCERK
jgi:serine/threonine protein kinase